MSATNFTQYLKCMLTEDEIKQAGQDMALAKQEKSKHEGEAKGAATQYKNLIQEADNRMDKAAMLISNGYEFRTVPCKAVMNSPVKGQKQIVREDTGELVRQDKMCQEDEQGTLVDLHGEDDGTVLNYDEKGEFTGVTKE